MPNSEAEHMTSLSLNGMSAPLPFTKMQALGNDFVFVSESALSETSAGQNLLRSWEQSGSELARRLCDRHFGIGADGLILVKQASRGDCDVAWDYINSDGSRAAMCGNGLRCLALWSVTNKTVSAHEFAVQTAIGPVPVRFDGAGTITTDVGEPVLDSGKIPVGGPQRSDVINEKLPVGDTTVVFTAVSMGNPHCVIFNSWTDTTTMEKLAIDIQRNPFFPEGVNVEFVAVDSPNRARVFVCERGCGPTLACASGAAAVLVAGVLTGHLQRQAEIQLPGGSLHILWSQQDNRVRITGPATISYKGVVDLSVCRAGDGA